MVHLGQLLVDEGLVEPEGVKRALDRQRHQGGHLGTNLLDEGVIAEEPLLAALGRQRRTPTVSGRELGAIPLDVLELLPRDLATRHAVVPFLRRGRTLYLASIEPGDVSVEDEITQRTSCLTRTCIGLELRVREALARYYGVPRDERLVRLSERLRMPSAAGGDRRAGESDGEDLTVTAPLSFDDLQLESLFSSSVGESAPAPPLTSSPPPSARGQSAAKRFPLPGPTRPSSVAAPAPPADPPPAPERREVPEAPRPRSTPSATPARPHHDTASQLQRATRQLREARSPDRVCEILLDFCAPYFGRCLLLALRDGRIVGWKGKGPELGESTLRAISLDASAPSVFFSVSKGAQFWLGPLPRLPLHQSLVSVIGGDAPAECVVLPIFLRDRVLGFLYADNVTRSATQRPPLFALRRLVHKAGLAYEVCVLRHKITRA